MNPKFILIKIQSKNFYNLLIRELTNYKKIYFFSKKINGIYVIAIKCENYYKKILTAKAFLPHISQKYINKSEKLHLSYIYLYTSISLILSELIIKFYEIKIAKQILSNRYAYLSIYEQNKLKNITSAVLDSNYPSISSKKLYLYRKDLILNKLLLNFRNCNYLYVDHFAFFKLSNYYEHLEDIISKVKKNV